LLLGEREALDVEAYDVDHDVDPGAGVGGLDVGDLAAVASAAANAARRLIAGAAGSGRR
jgi:hypothetical protein